MGVSRLLAKAWVVTCLFAGAHALNAALTGGGSAEAAAVWVLTVTGLFIALGLLFTCGYGIARSTLHGRVAAIFKAPHPTALFNDAVFVAFAALSFAVQAWYAPRHLSGPLIDLLEAALAYAVPGHAAVADRLSTCPLDGGRVFASAFAWMLALIFAASAISRLKHTIAAVHADRRLHRQSLSPAGLAAVLGLAAFAGIYGLFLGAVFELVPCSIYAGLPGALLLGLAPLFLAYLVYAALAALFAGDGKA